MLLWRKFSFLFYFVFLLVCLIRSSVWKKKLTPNKELNWFGLREHPFNFNSRSGGLLWFFGGIFFSVSKFDGKQFSVSAMGRIKYSVHLENIVFVDKKKVTTNVEKKTLMIVKINCYVIFSQFQTFNDRIAAVNIDVIHKIKHHDDRPEVNMNNYHSYPTQGSPHDFVKFLILVRIRDNKVL